MTSVFTSLFTRDPRNAFQYHIPDNLLVNNNEIVTTLSFKKVNKNLFFYKLF